MPCLPQSVGFRPVRSTPSGALVKVRDGQVLGLAGQIGGLRHKDPILDANGWLPLIVP